MDLGNNYYGTNYGYNQNFDVTSYLQSIYIYIKSHPVMMSILIIMIPILAFMILGFSNKNMPLGIVSILLLLSIFLMGWVIAFNRGTVAHKVLLITLIVIEVGLMFYFVGSMKRGVSNDMYVQFYTPEMFTKKKGVELSFLGLTSMETKSFKEFMSGKTYAFALKEDLPVDLGPEGTYSFWLKVCPSNFDRRNKTWRVVWYRGDRDRDTMYRNKTPGVYFAPNVNKLIITVACENGADEGNAMILENIPLNDWFCVTIVLEGRSLDCYMNGLLEMSISLTGAPKMMNSNIIKGDMGFDGLMAFFRYNSSALIPSEVKKIYEKERVSLERSGDDLEVCNW